jgi:hypothetical protein
MTFVSDISHGIAGTRPVPAAVISAGIAFATATVTRVAAPVETREGNKAICTEASGEPTDPKDRRAASTPEPNSDASVGCGWRLVYESELKQVFLDLVERDSDAVVMRIPRESLVRFLRDVAAESARHSGADEAQLDLLV